MKKLRNTLLTLGLAASTTLFLTGCSEGDHAAHDHDHGDADHTHEPAESSDSVAGLADAAGDVVAAMAVIEKPTEEQLQGTKAYPLETCLVSGEELGSMGDPLLMLVGDQQVKLCCEHCVADLKKDAAKLVAKLNE